MYKRLIKPLLFLISPEKAHALTVMLLKALLVLPGISGFFRRYFLVSDPRLGRQVMGIGFPNPVGLAAGFDKDGKLFPAMGALGFGFVELGTVTPKPQPGNPSPRIFRLPADQALINRMGFNNEGADVLAARLRTTPVPKGLVLGGNIGKNKTTPNEQAVDDYLYCFRVLHDLVDYFVVNVSSPNTPNLRELQDKEPLTRILSALQTENQALGAPKPILLKIAPDLTTSQLDDILDIVRATGIAGIVATNTTIQRDGLRTPAAVWEAMGPGGLSGAPLRKASTQILQYLRQHGPKGMTLIGVGGIATPLDAKEKLEAGADLVQVYTGLIYEGPSMVRSINRALLS
ncbi:MAG: quinone-dependent dihydroorotate dehydrogenase [Haliscomenobacter sp.]|nr:quinone-dependent dihydroorotate dehydrogenase [Haliscomenobacter sp.]MBP9076082.1 quinone-dependent dihydroorotate dehydrogenase [Haliscomenobacter sp.]MBP9873845.1 quinone-dependent dihydroorotate dehydrogenase [Haliscomenobacter sp.]